MLYKLIVCDPPWPEQGGGKVKRGADRHYPLMKVREIKALPLQNLADPAGCLLWLWATGNYLADAIDCARAWGFRVVTFRPWIKAEVGPDGTVKPQNPGLGQRMRCDAEIVLLCTLGHVPLPDVKHRQTLYAPRTAHSAKPDLFYEQIEKESRARPRLDMFARRAREGWEVFGNEAPGSIELPPSNPWRIPPPEDPNTLIERELLSLVDDAPLAGGYAGYYDQEEIPA